MPTIWFVLQKSIVLKKINLWMKKKVAFFFTIVEVRQSLLGMASEKIFGLIPKKTKDIGFFVPGPLPWSGKSP